VKIQTGSTNARSRAAIEKLGAVFEGVVRREQPLADGTWRDTAVFSVIVDEWPAVRAGLEARLAAWGERPVLFRSVPAA
jgi:RimJ/RimL family protein N-acetyltransferase